jgi:hypothetical protein
MARKREAAIMAMLGATIAQVVVLMTSATQTLEMEERDLAKALARSFLLSLVLEISRR